MKAIFVGVALMASFSTQAAEPKLKPGLWELSYQADSVGGGGMPTITQEQLAKMEKLGLKLGGANINVGNMSSQYCLSKEQAERSEPPRPKDSNKMQCDTPVYKRSGNTVAWKQVCSGERSLVGNGTMTISSPEAYSGSSTITTKDAKRGEMTMTSHMQGKWLADRCEK